LIGLHVAAIAFYYFKKKDDLVTPMVTGDKKLAQTAADVVVVRDTWGKRMGALCILALCGAGVYYLVNL
jgi:hypothetical protein